MASANPQEERQETKHSSTSRGGRGRHNRGRHFYQSGENQESSQPRHDNYNNTDFSGSGRASNTSGSYSKPRIVGRARPAFRQDQGTHIPQRQASHFNDRSFQERNHNTTENSNSHYPAQSTRNQQGQGDQFSEGTSAHQWNRQHSQPSMDGGYDPQPGPLPKYRGGRGQSHTNGYGRSQRGYKVQPQENRYSQGNGSYSSRNPPRYQPDYQAPQDTVQQDVMSLIDAQNQSRDQSRAKTFTKDGKGAGRRFQVHKRSVQKTKDEPETSDWATQRERLTEQLTKGVYECMVCCESVKQDQAVWSCTSCYHVFHLGCIRRWARSSQDESGQWRCPGCQSSNSSTVNTYYCFCAKRKNPEWNRREIPHSCGEVCGKNLGDGISCTHSCTLLCHPGPCPTCAAQTMRNCPCGKSSQQVKCGSSDALLCGNPCDKTLNCGLHKCSELCHIGTCEPCEIIIEQVCFCAQNTRQLPCSVENSPEEKFACGAICQRSLECGKHLCDRPCHEGSCESCPLQVEKVHTCPCGKTELAVLYRQKKKNLVERKQCTDPVPVCGQKCEKLLECGPSDHRHRCAMVCHEGSCPPCKLNTIRKCRCGRTEKVIPCVELPGMEEVLCERRCNKKRQCGRHKCIQVCCVDTDHICMMVCGRQLSCGLHRCEALCHAGNCARCYRVSFDELTCLCGAQVTYPPVPCGTRPPECHQPCSKRRPCGHEPQHACHPESTCPPCTVLCEKECYGRHEIRKNVPCHLTEISCGKLCGKPLPCGRHTCILTCHGGVCPTTCSQPCPVTRSECPHPCNTPCHPGVCPGSACREKVKVQCQCGQRVATVSCEEQQSAFRKMATALLASKMTALQLGECVDFKDLLGPNGSSAKQNKSLECNEECALVERNRRLALALQIKNPNPKPGAPHYPDSLKEWAKKDPRFVQMVHDKLTDLVQLAKQSLGKMRSRSHSFDPMNRDKRQFIHDYCVFFGCETASYDEEPKRNVVATAFGETSFLPSVGILESTQREMGQRKMPAPPSMKSAQIGGVTFAALQSTPPTTTVAAPTPVSAWGKGSSTGSFRTLSEVVKSAPPRPNPSSETAAPPPKAAQSSAPPPAVVDYFDFTS